MARHIALALALLVLCASTYAAQSTEKEKSATLGTISGTVTIEGKPASGVRVQLVDAQSNMDQNAALGVSDAEGHYELSGIPAGSYILAASAPAFVLAGSTFSWPVLGKPVSVGEGDAIDGMDLVLTPGGVITGRVTTSDGTPAIEETVNLLRVKENGEREDVQLNLLTNRRTDDRGVYRLFGLTPGRYLVSLGRRPDRSMPHASKYALTYYPGVSDVARAQPIDVWANGVAKGIDVTLALDSKTFSVSGSAHYADTSGPVTGAMVMMGPLVDGKLRSQGGSGEQTDSSGVFRISGLAPGSYRLTLNVWSNPTHYSEPLDFDVTDHDVTGLEVPFLKGGTISGVVDLDDVEDPEIRAKLPTIVISADRKPDPGQEHGFNFRSTSSGQVGPDGSFRVDGIKPGSYELRIGYRRNAERGTFYVWSTDVGGTPTTDLTVEESPELADVHVHVRYGDGFVKGAVTLSGAVPAGARIFVAAQRSGTEDYFAQTSVDGRGQFLLDNLPTGTCDVVVTAWARVDNGWKAYQSKPTSITVRSGTTVSVDLALDFDKDEVQR